MSCWEKRSGHEEAAAGVTTAVLAGRYLEARARARSGSALAALAALGAKTVAVLRKGAEQRVPVGPAEPRTVTADLVVPARGTLTLSPFGDELVLQDPVPFEDSTAVPLTLTFRNASRGHGPVVHPVGQRQRRQAATVLTGGLVFEDLR